MTPYPMYFIAQSTIGTQKRHAGRIIIAEGGVALLKKFETTHRNPGRDFAHLRGKIKTHNSTSNAL